MLSTMGIGALAAALTVATFGSLKRRGHLIGTGVCLVSAGLTILSFARNILLAVCCSGLIGFGLILFLATSQSVVQLRADDQSRGRIMGIWAMALSGALPLGSLFVGPLADSWGEPPVVRCQGIACGLAALALVIIFRPGVARSESSKGVG
jgi:MFS family permease